MDGNNNNLRMYSIAQAAKMLGVGRDTLNSLIAQGKIGVIKILKRNKISYNELDHFMQENTVREIQSPTLEFTDNDVKSFISNRNDKKGKNLDSIFDKMIKEMN